MSEKKVNATYQSIPVTKFHKKVSEMFQAPREDIRSFDAQLEFLDSQTVPKQEDLYVPPNSVADKNRYINVLPSKQNRVVLKAQPDIEGSDYINASFVKLSLQGSDTTYIATQAPVPESFEDFWRMVWEQKCVLLVMLTKEIEKQHIKAHRYWPLKGKTTKYGELSVKCADQKGDEVLTTRTFVISKDNEERQVTHLQYTAWPDHGVPRDFDDIVSLFKTYRELRAKQQQPVVVHCSAGIGRSGAFTLIDSILDNISRPDNEDPQINVFEALKEIRAQRPGSIQTPDQYAFVHYFLDFCIREGLFGVKKIG